MTSKSAVPLVALSALSLVFVAVAADPPATAAKGGTAAAIATPPVPPCNPKSPCPGSACATSLSAALAKQPSDACSRNGENQGDVDVFSWNSFLAMNWPANTRTCGPDTTKSILSGAGPTVWETYPDDADVFVKPPATPGPWCTFGSATSRAVAALPADLQETAKRLGVTKVLRAHSKGAPGKFPDIDEAVGGVFTDQSGRFLRYEKRLNFDEYNYLTFTGLWSAAVQAKTATVSFPWGPTQNPSPCGTKPCGPVGAMEIKAAWKVLTPAEIAGKSFYMQQAFVFNDDAGNPSPGKNPVTVGLVGLHIIHKTQRQQTWFWSTFEHVANETTFFNPNCPAPCPTNKQNAVKPYKELDPQATPVNTPVQMTRVIPIAKNDGAAPPLNTWYRGLLKGSVWANYQLVSTQWTTGGAPGGTPKYVGNTTLETFIQPVSSCFGCHNGAKTTAGRPADRSFLLGEAYVTPTPTPKPSTP